MEIDFSFIALPMWPSRFFSPERHQVFGGAHFDFMRPNIPHLIGDTWTYKRIHFSLAHSHWSYLSLITSIVSWAPNKMWAQSNYVWGMWVVSGSIFSHFRPNIFQMRKSQIDFKIGKSDISWNLLNYAKESAHRWSPHPANSILVPNVHRHMHPIRNRYVR